MKYWALGVAVVLAFTAWIVQQPAVAADEADANVANPTTLEIPKGSEKLMAMLQQAAPTLPIDSVFPAEIPGFYGVELTNSTVLYGSADGRFFYYGGDLYETGSGLVNWTEIRRSGKRKRLMDAVPVGDLVVFSPTGPARTYVNIFTDVDCGYCRKLHQEMADYNALGIEVRYLAYPRAGLGTPTAAKIISAWCADDRNAAMTALKAGQPIPMVECENPVANQYELGRQVGVGGTPAIVTADGRLLPGYLPPAALAAEIGLE